jgi:two-component system response regulator HydG
MHIEEDAVFDASEAVDERISRVIETRRASSPAPFRAHVVLIGTPCANRDAMERAVRCEACDVAVTDECGAAGAKAIRESHARVALVPLRPADVAFEALVAELHEADPLVAVIAYDEDPSTDAVVDAVRAGAELVISEPRSETAVRAALRRAIERQSARGRIFDVPRSNRTPAEIQGLIGTSTSMRHLKERIEMVARTRSTVLLLGETGTGKERVADAIHALSARANRPFVRVHCAALAETLLESELFGHERGAFTGANTRREGRFKLADGGTILLDEIGEISPSIQVKLLRVLQERTFERVGGTDTISVDVRLVAATHRDLKAMVAAGTFRADLYYRLNVVTLEVPSLRARREDIPALVEHHIARLARDLGVPAPRITPEAMRLLRRYQWPGNIRELENVLERALVMCRARILDVGDLEAHFTPELHTAGGAPRIPGASFAEIERHAILTTYEACGRSPLRTAETLGLSLRTVHYRLREYAGGTGRRRPKALPPIDEASTSEYAHDE